MLKEAAFTALIAFLTFPITGCQRSSYEPSRYSYDESRDTQDSRRSDDDGARMLRDLKSYVSRNPVDFTGVQSMVYEIEAKAPDTPAARTARRILEDVRADYEVAATGKYISVSDRARDLRDEGRFDEAARLLRKFTQKYPDSDAAAEAEAMRREIASSSNANRAYETFVRNLDTFREVGDYEGGYEYIKQRKPTSLAGTPYEKKLEDYISSFSAEHEAHKDRIAREDALPWEPLPPEREDGTLLWRASAGTWQVASGTVQGSNDEADFAHFMVGDSSWKDYIVEMQFRIIRGEFDLGVRGIEIGIGRRRYKVIDVCSSLNGTNQTVCMSATVRGDMITVKSSSLPEPRYIRITERDGTLKHSYGPICIYLHRGGEVEFTSLRVKHLSKLTEATAER